MDLGVLTGACAACFLPNTPIQRCASKRRTQKTTNLMAHACGAHIAVGVVYVCVCVVYVCVCARALAPARKTFEVNKSHYMLKK